MRVLAALGVVALLVPPGADGQRSDQAVIAALTAFAHRDRGEIPGALPPTFHDQYADAFRGWPVRPLHRQHPIRGSFLDPRGRDENGLAGYHFGIDINVDDSHPDRNAPTGLSHRVYALEGGRAVVVRGLRHACANRRLEVGHFAYWHVSPTVRTGTAVKAGRPIGWTCLGQWHVHVSEWRDVGSRRVWLNPLRPGGKIAPYVDTAPPVVSALRFVTPPATPWRPQRSLQGPDSALPLAPTRLHGLVELRAEIEDAQSFWGFLAKRPAWQTPHHPYRVGVEIRDRRTGAVVLRRITFQSDELPRTPYLVHYAPGTVEDTPAQECLALAATELCSGSFWFRPFSRRREEFWDTRRVRSGDYVVTVVAWDLKGNTGSLSVPVSVANP